MAFQHCATTPDGKSVAELVLPADNQLAVAVFPTAFAKYAPAVAMPRHPPAETFIARAQATKSWLVYMTPLELAIAISCIVSMLTIADHALLLLIVNSVQVSPSAEYAPYSLPLATATYFAKNVLQQIADQFWVLGSAR